MRRLAALLILLALAACDVAPPGPVAPPKSDAATLAAAAPLPPQSAVANFAQVVERVEPVAEAVCRQETPTQNCDFTIAVDRDPRSGVNAFQTIDRRGRPYIVFTLGLIAEARNVDELAFVMGHEAAHHIARHIPIQQQSAREGALVFGILAQLGGADQAGIQQAAEIGGIVGARRFSQDHELEADALGTVIAFRAGFDPERGARFFSRLPDPGDRFLGTHPPNAEREQTVRRVLAQLRAGG